jgi:hypothetical protein
MDGMNGIDVRVIDPFSDEVYNFRKEIICTEESASETYLTTNISYSPEIPEEVWKYSKKKWESLQLTQLYGVFVDNTLAAISGTRLYTNSSVLRLGMMYYVLRKFRTTLRSSLWVPGGMIESALSQLCYQSVSMTFISIYPHNSQLAAWCKALIRKHGLGQIGNGTSHLGLLKSYTMHPEPQALNGVLQYILYKPLRDSANIQDLLTTLSTL